MNYANIHNNSFEKIQLSCDYCDKTFETNTKLYNHKLEHSNDSFSKNDEPVKMNNNYCLICKKQFSSSRSLSVHKCRFHNKTDNKSLIKTLFIFTALSEIRYFKDMSSYQCGANNKCQNE